MMPGMKTKPPFLAASVSFALSGLLFLRLAYLGLAPRALFFAPLRGSKTAGESPATTQTT
jgi:hypothetical protein